MSGILTSSEGKAQHWYGDGKTEILANTNLEITYGVKTEVTLGLKSDFTLASQTEVTVGSKIDAFLGIEFGFKKAIELNSAAEGEFFFMDSYSGSVGADPEKKAAWLLLRKITLGILVLQTGLMTAATIGAIATKAYDSEKFEEEHGPSLGIKLGYVAAIANLVAALGPILIILYAKFKGLGHNTQPAAVLTMDTDGGAFLGTRKLAPLNTGGILVNGNGVQISSANSDLQYKTPPNTTSILGFQTDAGSALTGGSRLEVSSDGVTRIYGKGLQADLLTTAGLATHTVNAEVHLLNVTAPGTTTAAGIGLTLSDAGAFLQADPDSSVAVKADSVDAVIDVSAMRLTDDSSYIGTGGNSLSINAGEVSLNYGEEVSIKLTSIGVNIAGAIEILAPGAPGITSAALTSAIADVGTLKAALETAKADIATREAAHDALKTSVNELNEALVAARAEISALSEKVNQPAAPAK